MLKFWDSVEEIKGSDENVIKFIFRKSDAIAEAVLYKYPTYSERTVMCVSTQSGCPMGCTFCGTGKFFNRSLNSPEILEQIDYMRESKSINFSSVNKLQLMFMSMGEPILNMVAMRDVIGHLNHNHPKAQLLVSTSAPSTKDGWRLFMESAKRTSTLGLQFSVHESTDEARDILMPMKAKLTLSQISEKGKEFYDITGRKPFFNYCVHIGNNSAEDAYNLSQLFPPDIWECTLSVICESNETMAYAVNEQLDIVNNFSIMLLEKGFNTESLIPLDKMISVAVAVSYGKFKSGLGTSRFNEAISGK